MHFLSPLGYHRRPVPGLPPLLVDVDPRMPVPVVRSQTNRNHTPARPCLSKEKVTRSKLQVHRQTCNRILGRDEMDVSGLGSTRRRERSEIADDPRVLFKGVFEEGWRCRVAHLDIESLILPLN